jgi:isoleucyl-tRNA synthetase
MALDPTKVAMSVRAGLAVVLEVAGETLELLPEEVQVSTEPAPGLAVAADRLITVGIDSALTPELKSEGLAREIVRRIQDMRKKADFNIEDRISTWYQAAGELAQVFETWGEYIQSETLTTALSAGAPPEGAFVEEQKVEGEVVALGIKQNR